MRLRHFAEDPEVQGQPRNGGRGDGLSHELDNSGRLEPKIRLDSIDVRASHASMSRFVLRRARHNARAASHEVHRPSSTGRPSTRTTGIRSTYPAAEGSSVMSRWSTSRRRILDHLLTVLHPSSHTEQSGRVRNSIMTDRVLSMRCVPLQHLWSSACSVSSSPRSSSRSSPSRRDRRAGTTRRPTELNGHS